MYKNVSDILKYFLCATKGVNTPNVWRSLVDEDALSCPPLQYIIYLMGVQVAEFIENFVGGIRIAFSKFHHCLSQTFKNPSL